MADPLGVTASIIAVIQLSGTVIGYLKDVQDASKECYDILIEIGSTSSLLHMLNNLISSSDTQRSYLAVVRSLAVPHGPLDQFRSALVRLSEKLKPTTGFAKAAKALTWSFKKEEVKELLSYIERLKSMFSLALQNDSVRLARGMEADIAETKRVILLQGQQSRRVEELNLFNWLGPSKPGDVHFHVRERRLSGTGQWLLQKQEFTTWRDEDQANNILWCHGIPGAGKTVISSLAIDHLSEKFSGQNIGVVFFYCDFDNPQSQSAVNIIASLLKQLASLKLSVMEMATRIDQKRTNTDPYPDISDLETAFLDASEEFERVYLVVDAIDECDISTNRQLLLKVLKHLKTSSLRMFLTSRPHPDDIRELFHDSPQITIEASSEDIERYVGTTIEESGKAARIMGNDLKELVINKIRDEAHGMFLLPRLQIQTILRKKNKREMRGALEELPTSLNEIFKDTLLRIRRQSEENVDLAMRTLEWIFLAQRPLLAEELRQGLSVRPGDSSLDEEGYSLPEDMVDACLGLVLMDKRGGAIRFVHFTVQEYLLSEATEVFPSQGIQLASTCLTYLLFDEFQRGPCPDNESLENRLRNYQFFDYASNYWGVHLMECGDKTNDELALKLLKTEQCVLSILQNENNQGYGDYSQSYTKLSGLHLAASLGLDTQVKALLESGVDVNVYNESAGSALHLAVKGPHEDTISILLQHGADLSVLDEDQYTALHLAVQGGSLAITTLLCDAGADLLAKSEYGRTALHMAAEGKYADIFKFLIGKGLDVASEDRYGGSILHVTAENDDADLVKLLLQSGANASALNGSLETAMHGAAANGHESIIRILHEYGCEIDLPDEMGGSPLHRAAAQGHTESMRFLLENGANPNRIDDTGTSILHEAVEGGNVESIQLLLDYGVGINIKSESNETVIHKAAKSKDEAVLPFLVERGAILNHAKNGDGQTPLHIAASYGREANVRYLVEHGADIEMICSEGSTALFDALDSANDSIVTFLIDNGADTTKIGWNGNTMLHKAAESGSVAMIRLILQNGGNINSRNKDRKTVLHMISHEENLEGAELLIASGVDINAQDYEGITALHESLENGNDDLALLLISKGADVTAKCHSGSTVFHFAGKATFKQAVLQLLLEKGAELDTRNNLLETPLHCAAELENSVAIRFLVYKGVNIAAITKDESSVLHLLAESGGSCESVELLIAQGADPKAQKSSGLTVLHSAVGGGSAEKSLIRLLLEKGADVNSAKKNGISILHSAARNASEAVVRYLIEKGADINAKTTKGTSVIHFATENEEPERIIMLLAERGADIEERDGSGRTCLLVAGAEYGCRSLVRYLVEKGANIQARSKAGNTILHQRCALEDIELVKYLLAKGASARAFNASRITVLHMAIENGTEDTVRLLVEKGANPKAVDLKGVSALHRAVKKGGLGIISFLLEKGANFKAKDKTGLTALHIAVENRHGAVIQLLIEKGADINAANLAGVSVLHMAVATEQLSAVEILIDRGAKVNVADKAGVTALHRAVKGNYQAMEKIVRKTRTYIDVREGSSWKELVEEARKENDLAIVKILIKHGADVTADDKNGVTALKIATDEGFDTMVQLLIENGALKTSLFLAVEKGHQAEVRMLLSNGANVNSVDPNSKDYLTPLWYAVKSNHPAIVKLLLDHGANLEAMNRYDETPLSYAVNSGYDAIVQILLEKGANIDIRAEFNLLGLEFQMEITKQPIVELLGDITTQSAPEDTIFSLRMISIAAGKGYESIVKLLLKKEAETNCKHRHDKIPLYVAAWSGHASTLDLLLQREGEEDTLDLLRSPSGKVMLWLAVSGGHVAAVKLLLDKGAHVDTKYEAGRTLLMYAAEFGRRDVVELLEEKGADREARDDRG